MSDDVRALTAQLAADSASLAFLDLAEALRRRGQLQPALTVAANGLTRYPDLADAHALHARVQADLGDGESAFDGWMNALQLDPSHLGAHKGLGFLYYRAGDARRALRHLEAAAERLPADAGLVSAIARVRADVAEAPPAPAPVGPSAAADPGTPDGPPLPFFMDADDPRDAVTEDALFAGLEGARNGLLLLDANGMRLGGGLRNGDGADVSDAVAAHLAGVSREAARAARLLGLGTWQSVAVECVEGNVHLVPPTGDTVLLTVRDSSIPSGRLALVTERAAQAARRWLEALA